MAQIFDLRLQSYSAIKFCGFLEHPVVLFLGYKVLIIILLVYVKFLWLKRPSQCYGLPNDSIQYTTLYLFTASMCITWETFLRMSAIDGVQKPT